MTIGLTFFIRFWNEALSSLARQKREQFVPDLFLLGPMIFKLGRPKGCRGCVQGHSQRGKVVAMTLRTQALEE